MCDPRCGLDQLKSEKRVSVNSPTPPKSCRDEGRDGGDCESQKGDTVPIVKDWNLWQPVLLFADLFKKYGFSSVTDNPILYKAMAKHYFLDPLLLQ